MLNISELQRLNLLIFKKYLDRYISEELEI